MSVLGIIIYFSVLLSTFTFRPEIKETKIAMYLGQCNPQHNLL